MPTARAPWLISSARAGRVLAAAILLAVAPALALALAQDEGGSAADIVNLYHISSITLGEVTWGGTSVTGQDFFCLTSSGDTAGGTGVFLSVTAAHSGNGGYGGLVLQRVDGGEQIPVFVGFEDSFGNSAAEVAPGAAVPLRASASDCDAASQTLGGAGLPLRVVTTVNPGTLLMADGSQSTLPLNGTYATTITITTYAE